MKSTANLSLLAIGGAYLLAWGVAEAQTTVRMEAEDMQLDTYRIEVLDFASNGALINLKGDGFVGTATAPFPGVAGEYDISVVYHDENDGLAQLTVSIDDREVDSWTLDERVKDGQQPIEANRFTREISTGYAVATGDEITISGLQGNWDHANVDYIEFFPADGEPTLGEAIVLDFTDPDDCVINEPGYYILDRSWDFSPANPKGACTSAAGVRIEADAVTLDMKGFKIKCESCAHKSVNAYGDNIVLRNGILQGVSLNDGQIENLSIIGDAELFPWNRDDEVTMRNSSVSGNLGVNSGGDPHNLAQGGASISNTAIGGSFWVFYVNDSVDIRNCRFSGGLYFEAANGIIRNNDIAGGVDLDTGGTSVISWNTIGSLSGPAAPVGIRLKANTYGTVVEGNIIRNVEVGIEFDFTSTGNFFGNNRVSATTPFVGTDGQTDWGGNVSF